MTATDNSYVASGVGTYGDFIASPGKATQPAIWGFLTAASQARFSVGGLFSGWYWGVQGLGGSPDNSGRVGPPPNDFSSSGVFGTGSTSPASQAHPSIMSASTARLTSAWLGTKIP
jgi:hypothetical protein